MQPTTRKIIIGIIIAILVHLAIIMLLFMKVTFKSIFLTEPADSGVNELKKDWAARQPPPVVFYHEPDQKRPLDQIDITPEKSADQQENSQVPEQMQETQPAEQVPTEETTPPTPEPQAEPTPSIIETVRERAPEKMVAPKQIKKLQPTPPAPQAKKAAAPAKRRITLADITQSFMEKMDNIPTGALFMQGAVDNLPPDKQIIFERYRQKVGAIIDQVYKENPLPITHLPAGLSVQLYLALDKTGRFKDIRVTHSSGIAAIDDFCLFIYTQASKQFPPIPDSLDESLFRGAIRLHSYQSKPGERHSGNWFLFQ